MRMALLQQSQPSADSVQRINSLYPASQERGAMEKGTPKKWGGAGDTKGRVDALEEHIGISPSLVGRNSEIVLKDKADWKLLQIMFISFWGVCVKNYQMPLAGRFSIKEEGH